MNNNNRGNNRRRGRGNNRPQGGGGGGGGQQLNRIDSRARGNAPQMLEKYRKLAHDAHLNGDRVNAEYYLQFADHDCRVIADTRVRQEEQRSRPNERWQEQGEDSEDNGEFNVENDFPAYDQPYTRREREERDRPADDGEGRERSGNGNGNDQGMERGNERANGRERDERPRRIEHEPVVVDAADDGEGDLAQDSSEAPRSPYEPPDNPFIRGTRGLRPRREDRRPRREPDGNVGGDVTVDAVADEPARFDASVLPPPIGAREEPRGDDGDEVAAPAPKRRGRKPKAAPAEEASDS